MTQGRPFADLLAEDKRVTEHLDAGSIQSLLDPTTYVGLCAEMAHTGAARARAAHKRLAGGEDAGAVEMALAK